MKDNKPFKITVHGLCTHSKEPTKQIGESETFVTALGIAFHFTLRRNKKYYRLYIHEQIDDKNTLLRLHLFIDGRVIEEWGNRPKFLSAEQFEDILKPH